MAGSRLRPLTVKEIEKLTAVTEITKNHALAALDALVSQDKRAMADKVRQEGAAFFQWPIERDHVERNVFARIRKIRKRVLTDEEVSAIWQASEAEAPVNTCHSFIWLVRQMLRASQSSDSSAVDLL